jgi:hypothetical protein
MAWSDPNQDGELMSAAGPVRRGWCCHQRDST